MGLFRSTFYATSPEKRSDTEFVAEIRAITDEFEFGHVRVVWSPIVDVRGTIET